MESLYNLPSKSFLVLCFGLGIFIFGFLVYFRKARNRLAKLPFILLLIGLLYVAFIKTMEEKTNVSIAFENVTTMILFIYVIILIGVFVYSAAKSAKTEQAKAYLTATYVYLVIFVLAVIGVAFTYFMSKVK